MPRLPLVAGIVTRLPSPSISVAEEPGKDIAGLGATISDVGQHFLDIHHASQLSTLSAAASIDIHTMLVDEAKKPDYSTLTDRVKAGLEKTRQRYLGKVRDPEVASALGEQIDRVGASATIDAVDKQRELTVSGSRADFWTSLDAMVDEGSRQTGPTLEHTLSWINGHVASGVASGFFKPEEGQKVGSEAIGRMMHNNAIHFIDGLADDGELVDGLARVADPANWPGMDPADREQVVEYTKKEIERRANKADRPWPNDLDTLVMVQMDQASLHPRIGHAQLAEFAKQHLLSEQTYQEKDARLTMIEQIRAEGSGGGDGAITPSDVRSYSQTYLRSALKMDGPLAAIAENLGTIQTEGFGEWVDGMLAGEDPLKAAHRVADKYREQIEGATDETIAVHTFHVPDAVKTMAKSQGFPAAAQALSATAAASGWSVEQRKTAQDELYWMSTIYAPQGIEPVAPTPAPSAASLWDPKMALTPARAVGEGITLDVPPVSDIPPNRLEAIGEEVVKAREKLNRRKGK